MINIFEVFAKSFDDYRNNFFKASLLSLVVYEFYEGSFYTYTPIYIYMYFMSGTSTFNLSFLLGIILTILFGSIMVFGVYDYFLRISRHETYGFIVLRKNSNLKITAFFLIAGYFLTAVLIFLMSVFSLKEKIITGVNIYLDEYMIILYDFIPGLIILFYSLVFFIIIDNPLYSVWEIIREYLLLFRFADIFNTVILCVIFALLKYTADITRGITYIFLIPILFFFLANYYNELYFRKNS